MSQHLKSDIAKETMRIKTVIIFIFLAASFLICSENARAMVTNSYGKGQSLAQKGSVLIFSPRLFVGFPMYKHYPIHGDAPVARLVSHAVIDAVMNVFREKGYLAAPEAELSHDLNAADKYQSALDNAWDIIIKETATQKFIARKIKPHSIGMTGNILSEQPVDLFVFIQCFGPFDDKTPMPVQAGSEVAGSVATAVATTLTTGTAIFTKGGDHIDYKISVIDAKTGNLIWYLEGFNSSTDVKSQGQLMKLFEKILNEEIPRTQQSQAENKFKKRRSEIHQTEKTI